MSDVFISNLPSAEAIKLANAIYQTYLVEESFTLTISVARLCEIYGFEKTPETIAYFKRLFEELNEPAAVRNYEFKGHFYAWLVVQFCSFDAPWEFEDTQIHLALNELYLDAMARLMDEPYIDFSERT